MSARPKLSRGTGVFFWFCPACDELHQIPDVRGTFDGNLAKPTFFPAVEHHWINGRLCHYYLTAGDVKFCTDSTHALRGRTMPMPDIPPEHLAEIA